MRPRLHHLRLPLVGLLVGAAALAGCTKVEDASSTTAPTGGGDGPADTGFPLDGVENADFTGVTLRVGDQANIAKTLLETSGQLSDVPYQIEWATFASGPPLLEAMNADEVDIGGVGNVPPIFAQAAGQEIAIVGASTASAPGSYNEAIVAPAGSDLDSVDDLRGKKVAFAQGSSSHYLVLAALDSAGLTLDDIEVVNLTPVDGLAALGSGDLDAWAIWDPFLSLAVSQGAETVVTSEGLTDGFNFQVARAAALEDPATEAAIADYLTRLSAAAQWAIEHNDEWAATYQSITGLPLEVVQSNLSRFKPAYVPIDEELIAKQQKVADAFSEAGVIPGEIDVAQVFDTRYAALAAAGPGSTTTTVAP